MASTPTTGLTGNSYATIATADLYLADSVRALAWEALDDDSKARALITATRLIDKQCWTGSKTNLSQTLQWPRTGAVYSDGSPVDSNTVPLGIVYGTVELAYELSQSADLETSSNTGSNIRHLVADTVEIEYFRPGGVLGNSSVKRFPDVVMEYVGQFMCSFGAASGGTAFGTDAQSQFDDCDTFGLTGGF